MQKTTLCVVLALLLTTACGNVASAAWAFDLYTGPVDNGTGATWDLTVLAEVPSTYTASIHSLNPAGSPATGIVGQPYLKVQRTDSSFAWTGLGMCIDTAHFIPLNVAQHNYHVFDWAGAKSFGDIGTINPLISTGHTVDYIWNRLTYMWSTASVANDDDRAALQAATWFGCADQWDGTSGANLSFTGLNPVILTKAQAYLAAAVENDSTYAGAYVVWADSAQTFVTAVPEPGSFASFAMMLIAGGIAVRKRR